MEVLNVHISVRSSFSLTPQQQPFFGRGLCKTPGSKKRKHVKSVQVINFLSS